MSSPEQPSPEKTSPDWDAIERDFRAGSRAVTSIAGEHGITEGAIRKRAKRDGWVRLPKDKASTERVFNRSMQHRHRTCLQVC